MKVRVFVPHRVDGVYLHIHGGGWAFGSTDGHHRRLSGALFPLAVTERELHRERDFLGTA